MINPGVPPTRVGRALLAPWLLASLAILSSFALTRFWRQGRLTRLFGAPQAVQGEASALEQVEIWEGTLQTPSGEDLACLLVPFHGEAEWQGFRSQALAKRWDLPEGALMRLILARPGTGAATETLAFTDFEILDDQGECLGSLARVLPEDWQGDTLLTLLGRRGAILDPGEREQIAGWGRAPSGAARLRLFHAGGVLETELVSKHWDTHQIPRSFAQSKEAAQGKAPRQLPKGAERSPSTKLIFELEEELELARARIRELEEARTEREEEILRFNSLVAGLPLPSQLRRDLGLAEAVEGSPEPDGSVGDVVAVAPDPALARAGEIKLALRTLLTLEGVYALDLLEVGEVHPAQPALELLDENGEKQLQEAQAGWVGPVLFRILDSFGRLDGSMHAERLHLQGSRSSRTLEVVLSEGYESHQGERVPFDGGQRRIRLPLVDPERWIGRLPELFSPSELSPSNDDGLWELGPLRLELNALLAQGSQAGWYRVHGIGGVLGADFMDVQLQEFDNKGRIRRRLFADRLRIVIDASGVSLRLTGGAAGSSTGLVPFRAGKHSIFLPAALPSEWRGHHLPGVEPLQASQELPGSD